MPSSSNLLYILLVVFINASDSTDCPRDRSRVARKLINQNFLSHFNYHEYKIPASCLLDSGRDIYLDNELHKVTDNNNKWSCNYCGKTFVYEHWLDKHFDNRHRNQIHQGANSVCLSDHCDYLRCEVMSGAKKPSYWEQALCKQPDLDQLHRKCEATMKACLPEGLSGMKRHDFLDKLKKSMCNSLTCEKYWENPIKESSAPIAAVYIVLCCILAIGLLLYYLVAYTHFYSEHSLLTNNDGLIKHKLAEEEQHHLQAPEGTVMRNRYGYATSGT